ncbi:FIST C-terminal domain-containing protein [Candidatus Woesearchaeota archaeon]|nr:FIST C-terminal domain-containing protein [Candidatus Woesearchaeota archaeon]
MASGLIISGVGFSKEKDSYKAAKKAATEAIKGLGKKKPKISLAFYAGNSYNPVEINRALSEVFDGTEFVGGSTDAVIYGKDIYPDGIVIASLYSDYISFGVASVDNISKDPKKLSKQAIEQAVQRIKLDKYTDSYMAFTRVSKGNLTDIIRIPQFFVFALTRGFEPTKMGNEDLIIDGIGEKIGKYIPLFGGSLGSNMDNVFSNTPYEIVSLHSGKIMKDGLIVIFACTDLLYASSLAHGAQPHGAMGYISEVKEKGFVVTKISGQSIIDWYASTLGVDRKEFMSKILYYTQKYPLGFPDGYGNIVMRAGGVPAKEGLSYIAPFKENTPINIMNLENNKQLLKANNELLSDLQNHLNKKMNPQVSFLISCSSRRRVLDKKHSLQEIKELNKLSKTPLFGFCSFGEIGSKPAEACHFHHLCTNVFNIYEKLLSK